MVTILPQTSVHGKVKLHSLKIDMTPMVDLGFLLITFFIFTATVSQPVVTKLTMPSADNKVPPAQVQAKTLLTLVLDKNKVFVYDGAFEKAVLQDGIRQTGYDVKKGLGTFIRQKKQKLAVENLDEKMLVLIKPLPSASYQNIVTALDEMLINGVSRYAVIGASEAEKRRLLSAR